MLSIQTKNGRLRFQLTDHPATDEHLRLLYIAQASVRYLIDTKPSLDVSLLRDVKSFSREIGHSCEDIQNAKLLAQAFEMPAPERRNIWKRIWGKTKPTEGDFVFGNYETTESKTLQITLYIVRYLLRRRGFKMSEFLYRDSKDLAKKFDIKHEELLNFVAPFVQELTKELFPNERFS